MSKNKLKKSIVIQVLGLLVVGLGLMVGLTVVSTSQEIRMSAHDSSSRIFDVSVGDVSESEATIYWATSEVSGSIIEYGLEKENLDRLSNPQKETEHQMVLNRLESGKTYFFRIHTEKGIVSSFYTFRTKN